MQNNNSRIIFWETIILLAGIFFIFNLQFSLTQLFDADGYLHIRMAEFLKQRGLERTFPWARFTCFNLNFSDKDFIFHVWLIPFTFFENIFFGAKLSAATLFSELYLGYYWLLRRYCDRRLIPLFLILFFFFNHFLFTLSSVRPFPLVLMFSFLAIIWLIERRVWALFFLTLVYSLTHLSAPYMLIFLAMVEACRYLSEKQIAVKNFFAVILGIIAGILFHPYFPNNLNVFMQNGIMVPFYAIKTGVLELGAEFFPITTRDCLLRMAIAWIGFSAVMVWSVFSSKRAKFSLVTRVLLFFSLFFLIMGFISLRSFIHGWPLFLLFFASFCKDILTQYQSYKIIRVFYLSAFIFLSIYAAKYSFPELRQNLYVIKIINSHFEDMAGYMRENFPKKELVFTSNWSDPQYFIGLNPDDYYFVTLDPVYMYSWDKEKYDLYRDIAFGRANSIYSGLKDVFNCSYGYIGKNYFTGMIDRIRSDSRFEILKEDQLGLLFKLKD